MELRQIIQLKQKGLGNRKIAESLEMSRNTVNAYFKTFGAHGFFFEELLDLSDKDLYELFPLSDYNDSDRYDQFAGDFNYFSKELAKPSCTLQFH